MTNPTDPMTPPTAALPCPFCAKPPEVEECDDGSTWVSCSDSSMKCPAYGHGAELPVWNTRAPTVQATADADGALLNKLRLGIEKYTKQAAMHSDSEHQSPYFNGMKTAENLFVAHLKNLVKSYE